MYWGILTSSNTNQAVQPQLEVGQRLEISEIENTEEEGLYYTIYSENKGAISCAVTSKLRLCFRVCLDLLHIMS